MFERFTDRARRVLVIAQEEARELGCDFIGTEHMLLGLIREGDGVAAQSLKMSGVTFDDIYMRVDAVVGSGTSSNPGSPPFTPRAKKVLELSLREALEFGHSYIGVEHLLLALIREGDGVAAEVLGQSGVDLEVLRLQTLEMMGEPPRGSADVGSLPVGNQPDELLLYRIISRMGRLRQSEMGDSEFERRATEIGEDVANIIRQRWSEPNQDPT
jgi:ATP-dependent Clp protease ATP-binding subunit ClpC